MPTASVDSGWTVAPVPDPVSDLGALCATLPHKALHGQTRSLITFTPELFPLLDELPVAAAHDVTLLLIGETGAGKTHLARLIHELSPRSRDRCLTVGCGALPPDLIESELFGHVKGAFTGADGERPGKFAAAGSGTLLLDEIDALPLEQQAKLLRVIETGEYELVGCNETRHCQARLIVASNVELEDLVRAGTFRKDLYYRLNVLKFHLPPLRERPWDIEFMARHFMVQHGRTHGIRLTHIGEGVIDALRRHDWPGNIRELENVVRRAVLYCRDGVVTLAEFPSAIRGAMNTPVSGGAQPAPSQNTLEGKIDAAERRIIVETLRRHDNSRSATAKELGISRVTLYNKMKKFGLQQACA